MTWVCVLNTTDCMKLWGHLSIDEFVVSRAKARTKAHELVNLNLLSDSQIKNVFEITPEDIRHLPEQDQTQILSKQIMIHWHSPEWMAQRKA